MGDKKPVSTPQPQPKPVNVVPAFPLEQKSNPKPRETRIEKTKDRG